MEQHLKGEARSALIGFLDHEIQRRGNGYTWIDDSSRSKLCDDGFRVS
jgi:hypothetical protein